MLKPYYQDDYATIYHGDCREVLPQLEASGFAWTDPPYNVGKDYGMWNDKMPDDEYKAFTVDWISSLKALCPQMAVYVPTNHFLFYWQTLGADFKQIILSWSPEGAFRRGFVNQYASILTNAKPQKRTKDVWHNCQMPGLGYFFREETYAHPGYTSQDVTKRVLSSFAPASDLVIDPFCGSGTTLRAAKDLGIKSIGIEIEEKYCRIAVERLRQESLIGLIEKQGV
jgi:DNA modification methylase